MTMIETDLHEELTRQLDESLAALDEVRVWLISNGAVVSKPGHLRLDAAGADFTADIIPSFASIPDEVMIARQCRIGRGSHVAYVPISTKEMLLTARPVVLTLRRPRESHPMPPPSHDPVFTTGVKVDKIIGWRPFGPLDQSEDFGTISVDQPQGETP